MTDQRRRGVLLAMAAIVVLSALRLGSTWRVFSQTVDEPIHVAAGLQLLTTGRYDLDFEHPPLARILFAIGPVLSGAKVNASAERVEQGREIFCRDTRYRHNLAQARIGNLPFFLVALIVAALWARRICGWPAALLAAALAGSLPPLLGHAGLATTDMAVAATTPLALLLFWRWLEESSWPNALRLGLAIGLGLMSKFSFPVYFGTGVIVAIAIRLLLRDRTARIPVGHMAVQLVTIALFSGALVWSSYGFSHATVNELRRIHFPKSDPWNVAARYAEVPGYEWVRPDIIERYWAYGRTVKKLGIHDVDFVDWARAAGYRSPLAGRSGDSMRGAPPPQPPGLMDVLLDPLRRVEAWIYARVPIPAPEFFVGLMYVKRHSEFGHGSYFLGDYRVHGWWYYFPLIFLFKTPVAFTLLAVGGIVVLIRRAMRMRDAEPLFVAVAPLAMFVPAMASGINIGLRHILPVYPLFAIAAACATREAWRSRHRVLTATNGALTPGRAAVVLLLLWYFVATGIAHPDYLAYFNELAGRHPDRIAVDSNLDWGQDLLRLAEAKRRRHLEGLHLAYFGNAIWRNPDVAPLEPGVCTTGWVAISETIVKQGGPDQRGTGYRWLEGFPYKEMGRSIRLYDIPPSACSTPPGSRSQP